MMRTLLIIYLTGYAVTAARAYANGDGGRVGALFVAVVWPLQVITDLLPKRWLGRFADWLYNLR